MKLFVSFKCICYILNCISKYACKSIQPNQDAIFTYAAYVVLANLNIIVRNPIPHGFEVY